MRRRIIILMVWAIALAANGMGARADTLSTVKARGTLRCGVNPGLAGFAFLDNAGVWRGFDVDLCRAVATAVFGDATRVRFVPVSAKERFTALQTGEIDVLVRNTTWTLSRDTALGFDFAGINFYDGQGFMVRKSAGIAHAKELAGATLCVTAGSTTELNVADFFRARGLRYQIVTYEKLDEVLRAYDSGRCDAYADDLSALAAQSRKLKDASANLILPEIISKEPLGPAVRHGDNHWGDIVRWCLNAMILAEELGVRSDNVAAMSTSSNPEIRRLLGIDGIAGAQLGLSPHWARDIIRQVGNYGESYDRNFGAASGLNLPRRLNRLWTDGGLIFAPPIR